MVLSWYMPVMYTVKARPVNSRKTAHLHYPA